MYKREIAKGGPIIMSVLRIREDFTGGKGHMDIYDKDAYHSVISSFGQPIGSGRLYKKGEDFLIDNISLEADKKEDENQLYKDLLEGLINEAWKIKAENITLLNKSKIEKYLIEIPNIKIISTNNDSLLITKK